MNNKQLGRKFTTENINAKAARQAISLVQGFPAEKLANASDVEVVELFETLTRNMKDEVVSEMVENYEEFLAKSKENDGLVIILNNFLYSDFTNIITINVYNKFNELYPIEITRGKNELLYRIKLSDNDHTYWASLNSKDDIIEMLRRNSY